MSAPHRSGAASADSLRAERRAARRALDDTTRDVANRSICQRLLELPELRAGVSAGWYLATDGEVDLTAAIAPLVGRGVRLHLPVVGVGRELHFVAWSPGEPMVTNRYGIDEPATGERSGAEVLQVVVVPSVVVDPAGHRLGFGAGFYDRALAGAGATKIGVVFELQVVEHIEPEPWDVPLDVVVTESQVRRPGGPSS